MSLKRHQNQTSRNKIFSTNNFKALGISQMLESIHNLPSALQQNACIRLSNDYQIQLPQCKIHLRTQT